MAQQTPVRVALVSHSYITRLDDYMVDPVRAATCNNLGEDPTQVNVRCFGMGGARVLPGYKDIRTQVNNALADQRTVFVIHVGENDLKHSSPNVILQNLHQIIQHITASPQVRFVCVNQLLVFPCHEGRRQAINTINAGLQDTYGESPNILYCRHRGFWYNSLNLFDQDNCHLSDLGLEKYRVNVKHFVRFALRRR